MPPVRIRSVDQAISIVPHLLGYRPEEDLIVLVVGPTLEVTVRASLDQVDSPAGFAHQLGPVALRFPDAEFLVIAYSRDIDHARSVLLLAQAGLGPDRICDAIATDGDRWWSLYCEDRPECVDGHQIQTDAAIQAEAVYRGLGVLTDRKTLAATVSGPDAELLASESQLLEQARAFAAGLTNDEATEALTEIVGQAFGTQTPPGPEAALRIACLLADDRLATTVWVSTCQSAARPLLEVWTAVLAHTPEELATRPLMLCGLAAWLAGDGALESCCLERAARLDPKDNLFGALDFLQRSVLHPADWLDINPDPNLLAAGILADLTGVQEPPDRPGPRQRPGRSGPQRRRRAGGGPGRRSDRRRRRG
ncbi:DUF4192 domain-containing protein [Acidipropionibacterium virtanenii]|uniref:DUF4192 domain-containing protein n=1 Tax=Acidipropionibacterium virtanenii TaxID=2057246 RepID=A0A344UV13_9ACTN|nr:DUF4192 domain-containing protein [Acidipropionibacterium virtanenii]AXE39111.1 hypothetical protein JS278_01955 [Acidipropionibacterium virtanenii]